MKNIEKKITMANAQTISENELETAVGGMLPSIWKEYAKSYNPSCGIPFVYWFWEQYEKDYPTKYSNRPLPSIAKEYEKNYNPYCGMSFKTWFWTEYEKDYPSAAK